MDAGPGLLRAILDSPDDDDHRLVYADYLEETGQGARAEFIRVQVELARLHTSAEWHAPHPLRIHETAAKEMGLRLRANRLLAQKGCSNVPPWLADWEWQRGFLSSIECACATWLEHADTLLTSHPVQRVRLSDLPRENAAWRYRGGVSPPYALRVSFAGVDYLASDLGIGDRYSDTTRQQDRDVLFKVRWPRIAFEFPEMLGRPETSGP